MTDENDDSVLHYNNGPNDMLTIGKTFSSLDELEDFLQKFQRASCAAFYRRDAQTIEQCRKKGIRKPINNDLKYYKIKYHCIHGGKSFKSQSRGIRDSSTFQKNCQAFFLVKVDATGQNFIITQVNLNHNHHCNQKLFKHLPHARGLSRKEKKEAANLIKSPVINKNPLNESTAIDTLKNHLKATVDLMRITYGAQCEVLEINNVIKGIFLVTDTMKYSMESYPEYCGIDGTFNTLHSDASIYFFVIEDSEGCSDIVAAVILISENEDAMRWVVSCFKEVHPSWTRMQTLMIDKDVVGKEVIQQEFPLTNICMCAFHTQRAFTKEITCEKLNISAAQRNTALSIVTRMIYASKQAEYQNLYRSLQQLPTSIQRYFDSWHEIRHEWTLSTNCMQCNFLNATNSRMESLNSKIKSIMKAPSSLADFIRQFFVLLVCLKSERDQKAAYSYQKRQIVEIGYDNTKDYFYKLLTRYAFKFVEAELKKRDTVTIFCAAQGDTANFEVEWKDRMIPVTPLTCECCSFKTMRLPCRHIFAVREYLEMSLEIGNVCAQRWTQIYYFSHQQIFDRDDNENGEKNSIDEEMTRHAPKYRILQQREKYLKAFSICKSLAEIICESSGAEFLERLKVIQDLRIKWKNKLT